MKRKKVIKENRKNKLEEVSKEKISRDEITERKKIKLTELANWLKLANFNNRDFNVRNHQNGKKYQINEKTMGKCKESVHTYSK